MWDYAVAHGHGVEIFEFSDPDLLDDPARLRASLDWYRARRRDFPGRVSFHGAYQNLRPGAADAKIRAASRDPPPARSRPCPRARGRSSGLSLRFRSQPLARLRRRLGPRARRSSARDVMADRELELLLENAFEPHPQLLRGLLEAIALPQVGACFNVGHAYVLSALWARARGETTWPSPTNWLAALGAHVRYLHLSDNDGAWDQHAPLGAGTIPWPQLLSHLAPHPLPAVIEVSSLQGLQESERYLASIT